MESKKIVLIILLAIAIIFTIGKETYAYYVSNTKVTVTSTGSNIICDADITEVTQLEKNIFGYSEFKVVVKNYNSSNSISKEPFNYTLTVENNNGTNGNFGYNYSFNKNLVINDSLSSNTKDIKSYIIQVKSDTGLSENVNYKVKLNCFQN